jgi:ABC-type dipeptide/oligopeptide/nickel transport system permease component
LDYLLVVETVFDPGGVAELISVASFSGTITLTLSMSLFFRLVIVFAIEFAGEFAVIVFDPGGNQLISVLVNY